MGHQPLGCRCLCMVQNSRGEQRASWRGGQIGGGGCKTQPATLPALSPAHQLCMSASVGLCAPAPTTALAAERERTGWVGGGTSASPRITDGGIKVKCCFCILRYIHMVTCISCGRLDQIMLAKSLLMFFFDWIKQFACVRMLSSYQFKDILSSHHLYLSLQQLSYPTRFALL